MTEKIIQQQINDQVKKRKLKKNFQKKNTPITQPIISNSHEKDVSALRMGNFENLMKKI